VALDSLPADELDRESGFLLGDEDLSDDSSKARKSPISAKKWFKLDIRKFLNLNFTFPVF